MAKKWRDLSDKKKAKFGGNKKAFKQAKKQTRKQGGNVEKARAIVQTYKRNKAAAEEERGNNNQDVEVRAKQPTPAPTPAPRPPAPTPTTNERSKKGKSKSNKNKVPNFLKPNAKPKPKNFDVEEAFKQEKKPVKVAQPKAPKKSANDLINEYTPNAAAARETRMAGDAVSQPSNPNYGSRIGAPPGTIFTMDFQDSDGDGVDDRHQTGPGQPREEYSNGRDLPGTPQPPKASTPTTSPEPPRFAGDAVTTPAPSPAPDKSEFSVGNAIKSLQGGNDRAALDELRQIVGLPPATDEEYAKHQAEQANLKTSTPTETRMAGDAVSNTGTWSPNFDDVVFNGGQNQVNQKGSTTVYDNNNNKYTYSYEAGKNGSFSYTIKDQDGKTYNYEDLDDLAKSSIERYANPNYQSTGSNPTPAPTPEPTPAPSLDIDDSFNQETNVETNVEDNNVVTDNTLEEGAALTAGDESATVGGNNDVSDIQNQDKEFNFTMGNNGTVNNWGNLNSDLSINFNWNEMFNANAGDGKDDFNQAQSTMNNSATALNAINLNNNLRQRDPNQFMNVYMQGLQMSGLDGNSFQFQQFPGFENDQN